MLQRIVAAVDHVAGHRMPPLDRVWFLDARGFVVDESASHVGAGAVLECIGPHGQRVEVARDGARAAERRVQRHQPCAV